MYYLFLLGVCVIMPIVVVWIGNRTSQNETNKKTELLLKSIEAGATIDPEYFKPHKKEKTLKEKMLGRLTGACIATAIGASICIAVLILSYAGGNFRTTEYTVIGSIVFAVGIALFISYFAGKRMLAKELKAEEESLNKSQK